MSERPARASESSESSRSAGEHAWVGHLRRCGHERIDADLVARLLADPATRVVRWRDGRVWTDMSDPARPRLAARRARPQDAEGLVLFLGRDAKSAPWLAVVEDDHDDSDAAPDAAEALDAPGSAARSAAGPVPAYRFAGLRTMGSRLPELHLDVALAAQALAYWHLTHTHCPRCGAPTQPRLGGWIRVCAEDGSEHYPRTDPAVIMALIDSRDRLLLARNVAWPAGRFSVLAGFVEPGETLESAVAREVSEEVGIQVTDVTYVGSQPWPFPASLMLGFSARTEEVDLVPNPEEITEARWYTRAEMADAVASGRLGLPGPLSIARRLIERWYGASVKPPVELPFSVPAPQAGR